MLSRSTRSVKMFAKLLSDQAFAIDGASTIMTLLSIMATHGTHLLLSVEYDSELWILTLVLLLFVGAS